MIPEADIQKNAETLKRLKKAFESNGDDFKIYQEVDRSVGGFPKHYGIETVYKWMFEILGLAVGVVALLCAAGFGLALFRIILRHVN